MEFDFDLNFAGTDEEQLECYPKRTIKTCLMIRMMNKYFIDFKTCKHNGLFYYKITN